MKKKIPWVLTTDFNKEKHLFNKHIKTDYVVNTFVCSCSHQEFILSHSFQTVDYVCQKCGNSLFFDANFAWRNIDLFLHANNYIDLHYEIKIFKDNKKIVSSFIAYIPYDIDYLNKKVHFKAKSIYDLKLYLKGEIKKEKYVSTIESKEAEIIDCSLFFDTMEYEAKIINKTKTSQKIFKNLQTLLNQYLNKNRKLLKLPFKKGLPINIEEASFFFKYSHLKDFDFYYWKDLDQLPKDKELYILDALKTILGNRKERSIKRAFFENYKFYMQNYKQYSPYLIKLFIKKVKDVNILVKFLKLDIYTLDINKNDISKFLDFVFQKYSEKQIYKLFLGLEKRNIRDIHLFNDLLMQIVFIPDLKEFYDIQKPKCTIAELHESIIKYGTILYKKKIANKSINISKKDLKPCVNIDNYKVVLPKNGSELLTWANKLHNCMYSYFNDIIKKRSIIYCFFKDKNISFAVEIKNNKIAQAYGKGNKLLNEEQNKVLKSWFERFFVYKTI